MSWPYSTERAVFLLYFFFFAQSSLSSGICLHCSSVNLDLSSSACPDYVTMATEVGGRRSMMPVWPFGPFACRCCCPHTASPARQVIGALTSIKKWCNVRSELLSSISAWLKILDCCFSVYERFCSKWLDAKYGPGRWFRLLLHQRLFTGDRKMLPKEKKN